MNEPGNVDISIKDKEDNIIAKLTGFAIIWSITSFCFISFLGFALTSVG